MSAARKKRQLSRHARGYSDAHVARRRQLEPRVATGQVACSRCGQPIQPGQPWHLDHTDDRRGYLGPAHATCNLRAAANKTNGTRREHSWSGRGSGPSRSRRTWFSVVMQADPPERDSVWVRLPG